MEFYAIAYFFGSTFFDGQIKGFWPTKKVFGPLQIQFW
jgi:hypothetical protein